MRKSFLIATLLLLIGVGGSVWLFDQIYSQRNQVELTETCLYGDQRAVEGKEVKVHYTYDYLLFWDVSCRLGTSPRAETRFRQTEKNSGSENLYSFAPIEANIDLDFGVSGEVDLEEESFETLHGLKPLLQELEQETEPGEKKTRWISLSEYFEFYPITFYFDLPFLPEGEPGAEEGAQKTGTYQALLACLQQRFQIPITENPMLRISLTKNEQGNVTDVSVENPEQNLPDIRCYSQMTEQGCYFVFSAVSRDERGEAIAAAKQNSVYGVYFLPFAGQGEDRYTDETQLQQLVRLENGEIPVMLEQMKEAGQIALLTYSDQQEGYELKIIDEKDGTVSQQLAIPIRDCTGIYFFDDFFVFLEGETYLHLIAEDETGAFAEVLAVHLREEDPIYKERIYNAAMDWDGSQLTLATFQRAYSDQYMVIRNGFWISVYTQEGNQYCGRYDCSLDEAKGDSMEAQVSPMMTEYPGGDSDIGFGK